MRPADSLRLFFLGGALCALLATAPAAAQSEPDPFARIHARLDAAADVALVASAKPPAPAEPAVLENDAQAGASPLRFAASTRVRSLLPTLEPILRQEGVPTSLAAVALVESGGNPRALSPKGARGLWQFMPATARRYDLKVDFRTDERLDVEKSTRAAARHLRDLEEQFGSWELALAAYNAGADVVQKALRRAGSRDFATLSALRLLPAETRAYVPAVLAVAPLFGGEELGRAQPPARGGNVVYATAAGSGDAGP